MGLEQEVIRTGGESLFQESTELGQVMDNLDNDVLDLSTGMSKIDFNARLQSVEINSIMIIDELVRLGILPKEIGLTRQKKRLSVSQDGLGRKEKVAIVQGDRDQKNGILNSFGSMFQRRE